MSKERFVFWDKRELEGQLPNLFRILYANMSLIAPTGRTYEEDYETWRSHIVPAMANEQRQIVLMYAEDELVGYFQYSVVLDVGLLMMEEIQIVQNFFCLQRQVCSLARCLRLTKY